MSLGGLAALFAAAFLSGGVSGHMPSGPVSGAPLVRHSSGSAALTPGVTSAVLRQVGPQRWQVALLMADTGRGCRAAADYWLEISTPGTAVATAVRGHPAPGVLRPHPAAGSSCLVTVTFNRMRRVPSAATLDIEQAGKASTVTLTVSRTVSLYYYLGLPAITGGAMALVGLLLSLWCIRLYRVDGQPLTFLHCAFWTRPLSASGAWTVNDSWATNITALLTIVATILGGTAAVGAFFPGVAVDRFVVVNIVAGGIVAIAPLVFGVLYARWTRRNPGVMADATLTLPAAGTARIATLADAANATLPRGTVVKPAAGPVARLRSATRVLLEPATTVVLPGGAISLPPGTNAVISPGAHATLNAAGRIRLRGWWALLPSRRPVLPPGTLVRLLTTARAELRQAAEIDLPGDGSVALPAGAAAAELPARTELELPGGSRGRLTRRAEVRLAPGATVTVSGGTQVSLASTGPVTMTGGATARPPDGAAAQQRPPAPPGRFAVAGGSTATLDPAAVARLADVGMAPAATIEVPSGASIAVPGGATVTALSGDRDGSQQVKPGQSLQVPSGLSIGVVGGTAMAIPGSTDIGVQAGAVLLLTGANGSFTLPADDLTAADGGKPADARIRYPVRIAVTGGAKITVTGVTDVTLPPGTQSTAPYRRQERSELLRERGLQVPPPGGNVMFATVGIVLAAAVVTMFGIGAQIGIAGVLSYGLSEASQAWRWVMLCVSAIIAVLVLWYSVTAIRALADPRPGSSISATGGTSFTL
jgi:hypothetical protein